MVEHSPKILALEEKVTTTIFKGTKPSENRFCRRSRSLLCSGDFRSNLEKKKNLLVAPSDQPRVLATLEPVIEDRRDVRNCQLQHLTVFPTSILADCY